MDDKQLRHILANMEARQFIATKTLISQLEKGIPITMAGFMGGFVARWEQDAEDTVDRIKRRLDRDDIQWMIQELQRGDQEPPKTGTGADD